MDTNVLEARLLPGHCCLHPS